MAAKSTPKRLRRQLLVGAVGFLILAACVGLATLVQGKVSGKEFSPDDFGQRNFSFWEIPLVHLQVTPIRRSGSVNSLTSYLTAQKMIVIPPTIAKQPSGTPIKNWHLVNLSRGGIARPPSDAEILVHYLNGDVGTRWRNWSTDHPQLAAAFWPLVQRLAKRELYILIPDLFGIAQQADTVEQLNARTEQYVRDSYLRIATDLRDANKPAIARELLQEAIADYQTDSRLQALLQTLPPPPPDADNNDDEPAKSS